MAGIKIIGYSSDIVAEDLKPKRAKTKTGNCCYCEIRLNESNYTREHVIPKRRGGNKILPCCKECNYEKGGMMLSNYIRKLNKGLLRFKKGKYIHSVYKKLSSKIKNATKLQSQFKVKDMQTSNEKMSIGITKLRRRTRRFMIIYFIVLVTSIGISVTNLVQTSSERKSYEKGYNAGLDIAIATIKRSLKDTVPPVKVDYFVNHSEIKDLK